MFILYIEQQRDVGEFVSETAEFALRAAEHIDILTYNRIEYDKLTEFQKKIINRVHSRLTAFEMENDEMITSFLQSYSLNGVSMGFGENWNLRVVGGVAIPTDIYALLKSTGLCYPAI